MTNQSVKGTTFLVSLPLRVLKRFVASVDMIDAGSERLRTCQLAVPGQGLSLPSLVGPLHQVPALSRPATTTDMPKAPRLFTKIHLHSLTMGRERDGGVQSLARCVAENAKNCQGETGIEVAGTGSV